MYKLEIRSLPTGRFNKPDVLLHAAFQVLMDFMDEELPGRFNYRDPGEKLKWREVQALYNWWTKVRPRRKDPLTVKGLVPRAKRIALPISPSGFYQAVGVIGEGTPAERRARAESDRLKRCYQREDQAMLRRLIRVRHWLST